MPAVKSSLIHPAYKTEYRVRNWREYEQGLCARGDVTIWFSDRIIVTRFSNIDRIANRALATPAVNAAAVSAGNVINTFLRLTLFVEPTLDDLYTIEVGAVHIA